MLKQNVSRRILSYVLTVVLAFGVFSFVPYTNSTGSTVDAATAPVIEYGFGYEDEDAGYVRFQYERNSNATTAAILKNGEFAGTLSLSHVKASLPKGLQLTSISRDTSTSAILTFKYTAGSILFEGTPYEKQRAIDALDIKISNGAIEGYTGGFVDAPIVAEVIKENQIPYGARMYRELMTTRGGFGGATTDFNFDYNSSKYWQQPDIYNIGGSYDTLDLLPKYKTLQQATGYSCGVDSATTVVEYFGLRENVTPVGTTYKIDLSEQDLSKLRGPGREWGRATTQKELTNIFDGLNTKFGQNWNYVSGYDLESTNAAVVRDQSKKDINVISGKPAGNGLDMTLFEAVPWYIEHGVPVIIGWQGWGGHYQTAIGYDDMGTAAYDDDVVILMDSYDSYDQKMDGYNITSYQRLIEDWSVSFDNDFTNFVFAAAWPATYDPTANRLSLAGASPVDYSNKLVEAVPFAASKTKAYKDKLAKQISNLTASSVVAPGENHENSPYYKNVDPYKPTSNTLKTLKNKFGTTQQSALHTDGPASLLMSLNYFENQKDLTEFDLAAYKGKDKQLARSTVKDMTAMIDGVNKSGLEKWSYYTTNDMNAGKKLNGKEVSYDTIIPYCVENNIPLMVMMHEFGGLWQVVVGYDDMGTELSQDDIIILADPRDTTDHNQNGYKTCSYEWLVYDWGNSIDSDVNYHALVALYPKTVTVKYNANGGKALSFASKKITVGSTYGKMPTAKRTGYTLKGWYDSKTKGKKIATTTKMAKAKDHSLYAQWSAKTYTVKLKANAKKVKLKKKSTKVRFGSKYYKKLPKPTKKGYKFKGWYTKKKGGSKITSKTKLTKTGTTLYAHWKKK